MMKLIGREHVTLDKMFDLLSTPPVLASDTIYTTLMRHDTNEYVTLHSYGSKCLLPDRACVMPHTRTPSAATSAAGSLTSFSYYI